MPMPPLAITATFAAVGLLLVWMARPLIRRQVGPNGFFGLRVTATLADPVVWYEANARCARDLQVLGILLVGGAILLPWGLGTLGGRLLVALFLGGLVVVFLRGHLVANRLFVARAEELLARGGDAPPTGAG